MIKVLCIAMVDVFNFPFLMWLPFVPARRTPLRPTPSKPGAVVADVTDDRFSPTSQKLGSVGFRAFRDFGAASTTDSRPSRSASSRTSSSILESQNRELNTPATLWASTDETANCEFAD
eukprot:Selendium_serpulae@DN568_c0_g1_i1.p1